MRGVIGALVFFQIALFGVDKELRAVFSVGKIMALEDGSIWELFDPEKGSIDFVAPKEKVILSSDYEWEWEERCYLNDRIRRVDCLTNQTKSQSACMTFLGYTDFKKQTVQKIILDERSLTSKKVVKESQVKLQGAFVELADHALYRTQYVCLEGDSYPLNEWGKGDLIFLAYLNRSDTFLLNLTKGDFVGTDFLGELEETKALDAVISVEEKGVTLETLGVGFILVSDGDRLKSWQAQDEVIVRLFRAVGEKLILNQENAHGVRCALLQNVTRNKIALVQGFVKP